MLSGLTLVETVGSKNESELDEMFVWWMIEDLLIVLTAKLLSLSLEILFYIPVTFFFSLSLPLKKDSFTWNLSKERLWCLLRLEVSVLIEI